MLQNRVDPVGNIITTPARGSWMGNRGVIHNKDKKITHAYKHKAWIICELQFKGRSRAVMTPGRWTELFFLDEATAFAAGHRPCFECRKEAAKLFKKHWIVGNPDYKLSISTSIKELDQLIHTERIDGDLRKITFQASLGELPDGTFVLHNGNACVVTDHKLGEWSPFGYTKTYALEDSCVLTVLTPRSIVNAFRAGYQPQIGI